MDIQEKQKIIENILGQSDIVWPKYGSDTIEKLAERITKKIETAEKEFDNNGENW